MGQKVWEEALGKGMMYLRTLEEAEGNQCN